MIVQYKEFIIPIHKKIIEQIINYIDSNIYSDLNLTSISEKFLISKFYLHRSFKSETGESLINYIRLRKLTEASFLLLDTGLRIIDISQQLGYESQSSFSRAFKRHFKQTPYQYRENKKDLPMITKTTISLENINIVENLEHSIVELDKLKLIGLSYSSCEKNDPYDLNIPTIRDDFYHKLCKCNYIPKFHRCIDYNTVNNNTTEGNSSWDTFIAIDYNNNLPSGLSLMEIPASKYLCFIHQGELNKLGETVKKLWNEILPKLKMDIDYSYSLNIYENESLGKYFYPGVPMRPIKYERKMDMRFSQNYKVKILIPIISKNCTNSK